MDLFCGFDKFLGFYEAGAEYIIPTRQPLTQKFSRRKRIVVIYKGIVLIQEQISRY